MPEFTGWTQPLSNPEAQTLTVAGHPVPPLRCAGPSSKMAEVSEAVAACITEMTALLTGVADPAAAATAICEKFASPDDVTAVSDALSEARTGINTMVSALDTMVLQRLRAQVVGLIRNSPERMLNCATVLSSSRRSFVPSPFCSSWCCVAPWSLSCTAVSSLRGMQGGHGTACAWFLASYDGAPRATPPKPLLKVYAPAAAADPMLHSTCQCNHALRCFCVISPGFAMVSGLQLRELCGSLREEGYRVPAVLRAGAAKPLAQSEVRLGQMYGVQLPYCIPPPPWREEADAVCCCSSRRKCRSPSLNSTLTVPLSSHCFE